MRAFMSGLTRYDSEQRQLFEGGPGSLFPGDPDPYLPVMAVAEAERILAETEPDEGSSTVLVALPFLIWQASRYDDGFGSDAAREITERLAEALARWLE